MSDSIVAEAFHPGEFLLDELNERGWTQVEFAEIIGRPYQLVNEIIAGKKRITPETAKELGAALGTTAQFWMNLDTTYQLWRAGPVPASVARQAHMRAQYPLREMIKRLWIQPSEDIDVLESRLLRFFELRSLEDRPKLGYAAKQSGNPEELSPIQVAWLYRVKHIASSMVVEPYSKRVLRTAVVQLAALREATEQIRHVPKVLSEAGIRFVVVEPLPSSKIDAVCLWLDTRSPVIGMSLRYDRIDNFWFVLRHEIEHVLNGDGKGTAIIDSDLHLVDGEPNEALHLDESAANVAAADFCIPQEEIDDFIDRVGPLYSKKRVIAFAGSHGVHPGLVVGQLQRRINRYDLFRKMLAPIRTVLTPVAMTDGYGHYCPVEV